MGIPDRSSRREEALTAHKETPRGASLLTSAATGSTESQTLHKVSPELSAFTLGSANAWAIAASGSGPLFEGGRLVGQYHQAKAARDEGLLRYRQTALTALRDVSDALISRQRLEEVREQRARQVAALETAVKLSSERYVAGKASY